MRAPTHSNGTQKHTSCESDLEFGPAAKRQRRILSRSSEEPAVEITLNDQTFIIQEYAASPASPTPETPTKACKSSLIDLSQFLSQTSSSGYRGVYKDSILTKQSGSPKYRAEIKSGGHLQRLGSCDTAAAAAMLYAREYLRLHGTPPKRKPFEAKSGVKGVYGDPKAPGTWRAQVREFGAQRDLGRFSTILLAKGMLDRELRELGRAHEIQR